MWRKQVGLDSKNTEKSSCNFGEKSRSNCTPLYQKMEKQCKFNVKLNNYWMNLHKN